MDFELFKKKITETSKNVFEKTKTFGEKALQMAGDGIAKTPLFVRSEDEFNSYLEAKRTIFLAFDEKNEIAKELFLLLPVWQTNAFIDTTTFRYLNLEQSEILLNEKKFTLPIEMRIYFRWNETKRLNDFEEIKNWWKNREYEYLSNPQDELKSTETSPKNSTKSSTKPSTQNWQNELNSDFFVEEKTQQDPLSNLK